MPLKPNIRFFFMMMFINAATHTSVLHEYSSKNVLSEKHVQVRICFASPFASKGHYQLSVTKKF